MITALQSFGVKKYKEFNKLAKLSKLLLILVAMPIVAMLAILIRYSVNAPWWDQWGYIGLVDKLHNGRLGIHDLWVQHNEHRILVPKVFTLLLSLFTNYNTRFEVFFNWVFASGSLLLLVGMIRRSFQKLTTPSTLLIVTTAWLVFSPIGYINWIWGFQLAFFIGVFFTILGIWLLTRDDTLANTRTFRLSWLVAALGTYCLGNGITIWPIGLGLLLLRRANRQRLQEWCGVGAVVILSYMYKFHRSPESLPLKTVIRQPIAVMRYVWQYLGRNLATTPEGAKYTGLALMVLGLIAILYLYRQYKLDRVYSWLAVGAYGFSTALLAAASRLNFGVDHSMVLSYTTISVTFVVAVFVLVGYALGVWLESPSKVKPTHLIITFFSLGVLAWPMGLSYVQNYKKGVSLLKAQSHHLHNVQTCIKTAKSANDDCLLIIYPDKATAWQGIEILHQRHWGDF